MRRAGNISIERANRLIRAAPPRLMIYLCQLLALLTTHNQSPLFIRKSNDKYVININLSLTSGYYNNQCWLAMSTHVIQRDIPTMMSEGRQLDE